MEQTTLKPGETHIITLPGLGSAGYVWRYQISDPQIASIEELLRTTQELVPQRAGSLDQRFTLKALAPGQTQVKFWQSRPFDQTQPAHAVLELLVTVIGSS